MSTTGARSALLFLLAGAVAGAADDRDSAMADFNRFDRDGSGYLSRVEMAACGCASFDRNGDLILMPAEYLEGRGATSLRGAVAGTATSRVQPSGAAGSWRAGQRVKAGCYGNMKDGVIDRVEGSRAWVRFADEPNCDGFRDNAALRPAGDHARPGRAGQPTAGGAPPSGVYVCQKISGGALIGLGKLEIRGSTYSGLSEGSFAPFSVDDDGLVWTKALRGFPDGWTVTSSRYAGPDYRGRPLIKITYRTSRGSTDLIDCVRE